MLSITLAVVVVAGLGMAFANTRNIGLLGMALLCLLHPVFVIVLNLIGSAFIFTKEGESHEF